MKKFDVSKFWDEIKHSELISGAYVNMPWDDLPTEVKYEVVVMFNAARKQ